MASAVPAEEADDGLEGGSPGEGLLEDDEDEDREVTGEDFDDWRELDPRAD